MKAGTQVRAKLVPAYAARQPVHLARRSQQFHSCHQIGEVNLLQLADAFYVGKTSIASARMNHNTRIFMIFFAWCRWRMLEDARRMRH
jgi:hypothetical protein